MSQKLSTKLLTNPDRLEVQDSEKNVMATFTLGCYTVTLNGPQRTLKEHQASITHTTWVRTLPTPFNGKLNADWLTKALAANQNQTPDILAIALQYIRGAPPILKQNNLQIAGDAGYGPVINGKDQEGSDFNDYLGIPWKYDGNADNPEPEQLRCLDCSGFIRMIWGYRHNFPNSGYTDTIPLAKDLKDNLTLPRRAWQMYDSAPGIIITPNTNQPITNFSKLQIGDLVFFDGSNDDGNAIDHVGMYMGIDTNGNHRFISSRKSLKGPTMRDNEKPSILNGDKHYAQSFRAVRRL
ncbi:MAG: C40 family peptidase [Alkalinema sp. RU_4_3]|nr:C40 family peptidase [Alkalinema sp. RU_4_3]